MDEFVQWLRAQLDEDERIAREAGERSLEWRLARPLDDAELGDAYWLRPPELKHVDRHDPARVLRDIDAKRQMLDRYEELRAASKEDGLIGDVTEEYQDFLLLLLALPYADRPGYREEWRP